MGGESVKTFYDLTLSDEQTVMEEVLRALEWNNALMFQMLTRQ